MPESQRCVYCRERLAVDPWRPFCSERCKMADLGRWLGGHYRVPDASVAPDDAEDRADAEANDDVER